MNGSGHAPATTPRALALVRIGTIGVALPVGHVAAVLPGPLELTDFPCAPRHVLGAFAWRGRALPVLDLAGLIKPEHRAPHRPVAYALVLQQENRRWAVQIDEIVGIVNASAESITSLAPEPDAGPRLFTELHTAVGGGTFVLLDLAAVLDLAGVRTTWQADEISANATARHAATRTFVRVSVAGLHLAIEASAARTVMPCPDAFSSPLPYAVVRGFHPVQARNTLVVDPVALLELPVTEPAQASHLVALFHARRSVALLVDAVVAMDTVPADKLQTLLPEGFACPDCFSGSYVANDGTPALVIAPAGLLENARLAGLVEEDIGAADANDGAADDATGNPAHYLVFQASARTFATPLLELEAVINLDPASVARCGSDESLIGLSRYRGESLQLFDLGVLLGGERIAFTADSPVLVLRSEKACVGYLVDHIDFIERAIAVPLPHRQHCVRENLPTFEDMIRARREGRNLIATVLSLAAVTAAVPPISQTQVA